jgi:nucleoside-triphosphatase
MGGFITEEVRYQGERIGFEILTVPDGKRCLLAQIGIPSPFRVGRYGVNIHVLEEVGCQAILHAKASENIITVDEIGKMELFSEAFRTVLVDVLDSPQKVLATIMERSNAFSNRIKNRRDVRLLHLNRENFQGLYKEVIQWLDK